MKYFETERGIWDVLNKRAIFSNRDLIYALETNPNLDKKKKKQPTLAIDVVTSGTKNDELAEDGKLRN